MQWPILLAAFTLLSHFAAAKETKFWAIRGKRENILFRNIPADFAIKRAIKPNGLFAFKRAMKPNSLFGYSIQKPNNVLTAGKRSKPRIEKVGNRLSKLFGSYARNGLTLNTAYNRMIARHSNIYNDSRRNMKPDGLFGIAKRIFEDKEKNEKFQKENETSENSLDDDANDILPDTDEYSYVD